MITRLLTGRMVRALDDRLRTAPLGRKALAKIFPDHWTFMFGEIALYSLITLVLTGVFLTFFFEPSSAEQVYDGGYDPLRGSRTSAAYASAVRLSYDVPIGLLMRQAHHWAALIFVGAIVLHLARIFFTGAFRKPREINWLIGVTMLLLALFNGFTGYSMPDDLLSGTGLRIIYSVIQSIPLLGGWLAFLLFGGEFPGREIIPRMFVSHVFLVPALFAVLVTLHLAILVKQKHSQFPGPGRRESNVVGSRFWPSYTMRTLALFTWVLAVVFALGGLAQINPVWIYGPYHPAHAISPAQPDWYVAWGDGALRLFPPVTFRVFDHLVPSPFLPGVMLGALTFGGLYLWPFVEARLTGSHRSHQLLDRPREHPVRMAIGVGMLVFYLVLLVAAADDILAHTFRVSLSDMVVSLRVIALALPWPAGLVAYLAARALRVGDAPGVGALTRADLRAGNESRRHRVDGGASPGGGGASPGDGGPSPGEVRGPARRRRGADHADGEEEGRRKPPCWIELWQQADRTWRWRYREPAQDVRLTSNRDFLSREEALTAARTAYGERTVIMVLPAPPRRARDRARTMARRGGAAAGWLALLVIGTWRRRKQR